MTVTEPLLCHHCAHYHRPPEEGGTCAACHCVWKPDATAVARWLAGDTTQMPPGHRCGRVNDQGVQCNLDARHTIGHDYSGMWIDPESGRAATHAAGDSITAQDAADWAAITGTRVAPADAAAQARTGMRVLLVGMIEDPTTSGRQLPGLKRALALLDEAALIDERAAEAGDGAAT